MQKFLFSFLTFFLAISGFSFAQENVWTLSESVQYALEHNIDMRKSALNERLAKIQLKQSQLSQIPNASVSGNYGKSLGRSVDPTSNQFINSSYDFIGVNGNADVLLFGWFQKRNTIAANRFTLKAARADFDQLQDDISLNVATAFLRILLAKENIAIAQNQLLFSEGQKKQTDAFVNAGRSPELESAQMEAQVANDSSLYYTAVANYEQSVLEMKALMNLDIAAPFEVQMPDIGNVSYEEMIQNTPNQIYEVASTNFNSIKAYDLKVSAAQKTLAVRKGNLYPQLGLGYQMGTNYSSTLKDYSDFKVVGSEATGNYIDINGTPYPVLQPTIDFSSRTIPISKQFDNNFRQTVALSLTIPLFNGWVGKSSVLQAKAEVENTRLDQERARNKLKQDVFQAYTDASVAIKKYAATKKASFASARALDFAQKRYELGLMNTVELLTTKNTNLKAQSDEASAKYDLFFKLKVIDYYLGKKLTL